MVITECRKKTTATCNNNNICDKNESCNCPDCNDKIDHCGIDGLGQQLICTKDTAPKCYTDKFPYCLPACLNGYKLDTVTNTCQPTTSVCGGPKMTVNFTRNDNAPNAITLGSSTVLTNNPSFYLTSNGTAITDSALLYDTPNLAVRRHDGYVEFLARNSLAQYGYYTGTITLENAKVTRVEGGLTTYNYTDIGLEPIEADSATKTSDTVVNFQIAFALQGDSFRIYYTPATTTTCGSAPAPSSNFSCTVRRRTGTEVATAECNAGEVRVGGGCANMGGGGAYRWTNFPIAAGQAPAGYPAVTNDGWACATGSTGTYVEAFATCCTGVGEGTTTIRKSAPGSIVAQVECNAGETRI